MICFCSVTTNYSVFIQFATVITSPIDNVSRIYTSCQNFTSRNIGNQSVRSYFTDYFLLTNNFSTIINSSQNSSCCRYRYNITRQNRTDDFHPERANISFDIRYSDNFSVFIANYSFFINITDNTSVFTNG